MLTLLRQCSPTRHALNNIRQILRLVSVELDKFVITHLTIAIILTFAASALAALAPVFLQRLIDGLSLPTDSTASFALLISIAAYVGMQWLARSFSEISQLTHSHADRRLQRRLSARMFDHVIALPFRKHLDRETGNTSQTLTNGLLGYRIVLQHSIFTVLPVFLQIVIVTAVLLSLNHTEILIIIGLSMLFYAFAFAVGALRIVRPARAAAAGHVAATAALTDGLLNFETIKYFCAESQIKGRFEGALLETERQWSRFHYRKLNNALLVAIIFALSLSATLYVAAAKVSLGAMTIGEFVLVVTYLLQLFAPVESLGFAIRDIAQGFTFIERMAELCNAELEPDSAASHSNFPSGRGELAFNRVSLSHAANRRVLDEVSFTIPPGSTVAVVGESGAGKSSLIRLIFRLFEPDSGRILLNGLPISAVPLSTLRRKIAVVPQEPVLFNDSIWFNIGLGEENRSREDIVRAAQLAHAHNFIKALPDGYDTRVGERGLKLSGGEKQRIAIARAALKKPLLYIFDEATSSLDSHTEQEILTSIAAVSRETSTLIIAHRLSTIVQASEILVLANGRLVERGTHLELVKANGRYSMMWNAQLGRPNELATPHPSTDLPGYAPA